MSFLDKVKIISLILFSGFLLSGCTSKNFEKNLNMNQNSNPNIDLKAPTETNKTVSPLSDISDTFVSLQTKDGEIVIKLFSKQAPNTVANFIKKAEDGFYKDLIFHRVIPGFMAQGGDPTGTGSGGGKQPSELNNLPFVRGTIGLARTAETNQVSNDSQFFICFTTQGCQHLTGDYVNFGEVISGFDILDQINQGDKILNINATK
jgi:cyclophilin family peptidyl-prolyl cis-trans isomerase